MGLATDSLMRTLHGSSPMKNIIHFHCTPWQRQYHLRLVSLVERVLVESMLTFFVR